MACLRKKKGLIVDYDDEQTEKERTKLNKLDVVDLPYLPEDMIFEHVLTRISPARTLYLCSSVSKLWYNSIYNDTRLATSHFVQNQNKLSFFFNLLNQPVAETVKKSYIFRVETDDDDRFRMFNGFNLNTMSTTELVGCCNGLVCFKLVVEDPLTAIILVNPTRGDELCIYHPNLKEKQGYIPLCQGFGFDTISQVYKVVLIFTSKENVDFLCVVYTLGTNDWRLTSTRVAEISSPPGLPPFRNRMVTRISRKSSRSATICGGDLFWRTTNDIDHNTVDFEMLLSFDLHHEKIQFTRLPTVGNMTPAYTDEYFGNEYIYIYVDHHLLEFKGYPCIARLEYFTITNSCLHRCLSLFCARCCVCSVVLYLLKDVNQEWVEWETFKHFQIKDPECLVPRSFRCGGLDTLYEISIAAAITTTAPPMHLLTCSDQVLMYWYDGVYLTLYNLHTKHLKVVKGSCDYQHIYCPYMVYQLHAQVENIHTLKTFMPDEEVVEYDCFEEFIQSVEIKRSVRYFQKKKRPVGWLVTGRDVPKYYSFF